MSLSTADLPDGITPARDARSELAELRAQVERMMQGRGTTLGVAGGAVADGSRRLREIVEENAGVAAGAVRGYPLVALALAAGGGYLLGRMMAGRR